MRMSNFGATSRFLHTSGVVAGMLAVFLFAGGCETQSGMVGESESQVEDGIEEEAVAEAPQTVPPTSEVPEMIVVRTGPVFSAPDVEPGAEPMDFLTDREEQDDRHYIEIRTDANGKEYRLGVLTHKGQPVTPPAIGGTRKTGIGTFRYLGDTPSEEHPLRVGWLRISR